MVIDASVLASSIVEFVISDGPDLKYQSDDVSRLTDQVSKALIGDMTVREVVMNFSFGRNGLDFKRVRDVDQKTLTILLQYGKRLLNFIKE